MASSMNLKGAGQYVQECAKRWDIKALFDEQNAVHWILLDLHEERKSNPWNTQILHKIEQTEETLRVINRIRHEVSTKWILI